MVGMQGFAAVFLVRIALESTKLAHGKQRSPQRFVMGLALPFSNFGGVLQPFSLCGSPLKTPSLPTVRKGPLSDSSWVWLYFFNLWRGFAAVFLVRIALENTKLAHGRQRSTQRFVMGLALLFQALEELDFAYLFVVDVTQQLSYLLVAGGRELALAKSAFPEKPLREAKPGLKAPGGTFGEMGRRGTSPELLFQQVALNRVCWKALAPAFLERGCCYTSVDGARPFGRGNTIRAEETLMEVGGLVSRKAQFVPAFFAALNGGFSCHKEPNSTISEELAGIKELSGCFDEGSEGCVESGQFKNVF